MNPLEKLLEQFVNTPLPQWNDVIKELKGKGFVK